MIHVHINTEVIIAKIPRYSAVVVVSLVFLFVVWLPHEKKDNSCAPKINAKNIRTQRHTHLRM